MSKFTYDFTGKTAFMTGGTCYLHRTGSGIGREGPAKTGYGRASLRIACSS